MKLELEFGAKQKGQIRFEYVSQGDRLCDNNSNSNSAFLVLQVVLQFYTESQQKITN